MAPQLYGWQHLTYLAIFLVVLIATILVVHFYIKTDKQKLIFIKCLAGLLLIWIIINRVSVAIRFSDVWMFIPNSYCGMTSLVLSILVLVGKPNMKAYHFLWYMALFGGVATMFYPDFLSQDISFFYLPTISGLIHHSILLTLSIVMLQTKWFRPELKCWKYFPIGLSAYTLFGLFTMSIFGWGSAMEINSSLIDGTPLNWWFILLVGSAALLVFLLIYDRIAKKISEKTAEKAQN
jgi:hypothetical protein